MRPALGIAEGQDLYMHEGPSHAWCMMLYGSCADLLIVTHLAPPAKTGVTGFVPFQHDQLPGHLRHCQLVRSDHSAKSQNLAGLHKKDKRRKSSRLEGGSPSVIPHRCGTTLDHHRRCHTTLRPDASESRPIQEKRLLYLCLSRLLGVPAARTIRGAAYSLSTGWHLVHWSCWECALAVPVL
jgi:hypothetical protein